MIIIGIDPGFRYAGFSVIHKNERGIHLLDYGYLKMQSTQTIAERIYLFHSFFAEKIIYWQVTNLALETPFLGKNAQNFLKLGYLRGILYLLSHTHKLILYEFSPREVKQAVTGFGGADKEQVASIIMQLFPKMPPADKEDITDAIAVTLCALWRKNTYIHK